MSAETIPREYMQGDEVISRLGMTVFEKLFSEIDIDTETIDAEISIDIKNSLTRLGDGQTVPDER